MSSLKSYITIDDSPSPHSEALIDHLAARDICAILFCRGDHLAENPAPAVYAVQKGMVLGNHNFSHTPAGDMTYEQVVGEIERTEQLIEAAYRRAGAPRPGKYFRFPYLDKGNGDRLERRFAAIIQMAGDVDLSGDDRVRKLQSYLKAEGFTQPFKNVTHPLYRNPDVAGAADCLFTYSSCDWMLTARHAGKWPYKTVADLKRKIDDDAYLCREGGAQIALFHDQPDIPGVAAALIDHMAEKGFVFPAPECGV